MYKNPSGNANIIRPPDQVQMVIDNILSQIPSSHSPWRLQRAPYRLAKGHLCRKVFDLETASGLWQYDEMFTRLLDVYSHMPSFFNLPLTPHPDSYQVTVNASLFTECSAHKTPMSYNICEPTRLALQISRLGWNTDFSCILPMEQGVPKPFKSVIRANIGDCHALGQKPITFIRQVLALASCPDLMTSPDIPDDVKERVREILTDCTKGSVGSYSPAAGLRLVRTHVAQFLSARDGVAADIDDIYLGSGASDLIKAVLTLFVQNVNGKPSGVMIPIPQYPLFSATLSELGLQQVHYFLEEERGWALHRGELERSWRAASHQCSVRALVLINPGNPTGQVLSRENMEEVVKFAYERNLFILADEVYQENIISKPFLSFKKVVHELGAPYSGVQLASFTTCSKGWAAECGLRAGAAELLRLEPRVAAALRAARAAQQCAGVLGQCVLDCVMRPPAPGSPSHALWAAERGRLQRVLGERALAASEAFNSIPGYSCNTIDGAMFAFPRVVIPSKAREAAAERGLASDEFYCLCLLEETGICVVPGSGFGQRPGTFHFRTTILHSREEFDFMLDSIRRFHLHFLNEYS